jgi:hypothetical protein
MRRQDGVQISLTNVLDLLSARRGNFLLESGHHTAISGRIWRHYAFDRIACKQKRLILRRPFQKGGLMLLAYLSSKGALVGPFVALNLNVDLAYSERFVRPSHDGLFPAGYRIPAALRDKTSASVHRQRSNLGRPAGAELIVFVDHPRAALLAILSGYQTQRL